MDCTLGSLKKKLFEFQTFTTYQEFFIIDEMPSRQQHSDKALDWEFSSSAPLKSCESGVTYQSTVCNYLSKNNSKGQKYVVAWRVLGQVVVCMLFKSQNCSFLQNKKGGDPRPVNLVVSENVWGFLHVTTWLCKDGAHSPINAHDISPAAPSLSAEREKKIRWVELSQSSSSWSWFSIQWNLEFLGFGSFCSSSNREGDFVTILIRFLQMCRLMQ